MKLTVNSFLPNITRAMWSDVIYPGTGMTEESLFSLPNKVDENLVNAEVLISELENSVDDFYTVGISELEQITQELPSITTALQNQDAFYRQTPSETISDTFNSLDTIESTSLNIDLLRGYVTRPVSGVTEAQTKVSNVRLLNYVGIPGNNSEISAINDVSDTYNAANPSPKSLDSTLAKLTIDVANSKTPSIQTVADISEDNNASVLNAFDGNTDTYFEWERVQVDPQQPLGYAGYSRVHSAGIADSNIYSVCSTGGWSGYIAWPDKQFNWGNSTISATSNSGTTLTVYSPSEPKVRFIEETGDSNFPGYQMIVEFSEDIETLDMDIDFLIRYVAVKINSIEVSQDQINWRSVTTNETITGKNSPFHITLGGEEGTKFKYLRITLQSLAWYIPPKGIAHPYITSVSKVEERTYVFGVNVSSKKYFRADRGDVTPYVVGTCPVTLNGTKYVLGRVATAMTSTSGTVAPGGGTDGVFATVMSLGAAAIAAAQSTVSLTIGSTLVTAINTVAKTVGASVSKTLFSLPGNVVGWAILGIDLLTGGAIGKFLADLILGSSRKVIPKGTLAGNDILYGRRSAISIRNIFFSNPTYVGSGELVTKPYVFSKSYNRFVFDAKETAGAKYYIRVGTEDTLSSAEWSEITPAYKGDPSSSVIAVAGDRVQVKIVMSSEGTPITNAIFVEGSN